MNTNTITQDYHYLNGLDPSNYYALQYTYGDISNNIYMNFNLKRRTEHRST
ncbi:MAG: hypothetical protein ACLRSW_04550 [Christensenellaceae bacterium]